MSAKKVRVNDLINGKFLPGSKEEMTPSYVITPYGEKISRVNIIGTIVEKYMAEGGTFSSVTIDDGTDSIRIKSFEGLPFEGFDIGNMIRVIGRVKEYNGEIYITHELMQKIDDVNLELLAKSEILTTLMRRKKIVDDIKLMSSQVDEVELRNYAKDVYSLDEESLATIIEMKKKEIDYKPVVLEVMEKIDEGSGVEIRKLFDILNLPKPTIEKTLNDLINEGFVYEPIVGFLKKI